MKWGAAVVTQLTPKFGDACSGPDIRCKSSGMMKNVRAGVHDDVVVDPWLPWLP